MLKKLLPICFAATLLSACNQNLSTTLYVRDIHDLLAPSAPESIPIDIDIEILATGIEEQCSKPEGRQIVNAIAAVFQKAVLVGCEKISGSMNDRMSVRATTVLSAPKTGDIIAGAYLVHFDIFKDAGKGDAFVAVRFNPDKYQELEQRIKNINMMLAMKLQEATIVVSINNDERHPVGIMATGGVFADGEPLDVSKDFNLSPRQQINIKLGDVKLAYLAKSGWAGLTTIKADEAK